MIKTKDYEFSAKNDSKVKVEIKTEIENLNKDDLQEILSEFAIRTRDFYLGLGNEINKDNKVKKVIKVKKICSMSTL